MTEICKTQWEERREVSPTLENKKEREREREIQRQRQESSLLFIGLRSLSTLFVYLSTFNKRDYNNKKREKETKETWNKKKSVLSHVTKGEFPWRKEKNEESKKKWKKVKRGEMVRRNTRVSVGEGRGVKGTKK